MEGGEDVSAKRDQIVSGMEWEAQSYSGTAVYVSCPPKHAQSFLWSTDCLVVVSSFRPSHTPYPGLRQHVRAVLNLVRQNPAHSPTAALVNLG